MTKDDKVLCVERINQARDGEMELGSDFRECMQTCSDMMQGLKYGVWRRCNVIEYEDSSQASFTERIEFT